MLTINNITYVIFLIRLQTWSWGELNLHHYEALLKITLSLNSRALGSF